MQRKILIGVLIKSAMDLLAILLSITFLSLIYFIEVPLDVTLILAVVLTIAMNIPFLLVLHTYINQFITKTIIKELKTTGKPPLKIKLPLFTNILTFYLPFFVEGLFLYVFVNGAYDRTVLSFIDAMWVILLSKIMHLLLRPIFQRKGVD